MILCYTQVCANICLASCLKNNTETPVWKTKWWPFPLVVTYQLSLYSATHKLDHLLISDHLCNYVYMPRPIHPPSHLIHFVINVLFHPIPKIQISLNNQRSFFCQKQTFFVAFTSNALHWFLPVNKLPFFSGSTYLLFIFYVIPT